MTVRLLTPLPARIRLRLYAEWHIDHLAARLVERQHTRAALWLWRACRML